MLGQRDLRAKASMQCLFGLVNEPYFILFSRISFNFKVLILGRPGLASHLLYQSMSRHAQAYIRACDAQAYTRACNAQVYMRAWDVQAYMRVCNAQAYTRACNA